MARWVTSSPAWGNLVRFARKGLGLTQVQAAKRAGVSTMTFRASERGDVPSRDIIASIARALDLSVNESLFAAGFVPLDLDPLILSSLYRIAETKNGPGLARSLADLSDSDLAEAALLLNRWVEDRKTYDLEKARLKAAEELARNARRTREMTNMANVTEKEIRLQSRNLPEPAEAKKEMTESEALAWALGRGADGIEI